jgi:phage baseplate assembly protein W
MIKTYAPKVPFELTENEKFVMIDDFLQNARQKIKMIVMTNPGERIMDPEFGVGIRRYLFEPTRGVINNEMEFEDFNSKILQEIKTQVKKYGGDVLINDVLVQVEDQVLYLKIEYTIANYVTDTLDMVIK